MGISLGLIGGGGSILTVPILVYLFHMGPLEATTASLFIVGSTALVGAVLMGRKNLIDFKIGFHFAIPSFAGVFISRHYILPNIPHQIFSLGGFSLTKPLLVMGLFAVLMIFASKAMISSGKSTPAPKDPSPKANRLTAAWQGLFVGMTTGFVGAGGGFLIIPALVLFLRLPMKTAVGTSLAIIAANSLFGFAIGIQGQVFDWPLLIKIVAIGTIGIFVGQTYSSNINEKNLKRAFGYFVLLVGTLVFIDQIRSLGG